MPDSISFACQKAVEIPFRRQKFIYTNINNISENQMYHNEQIHRNADLQARLVEVSQATFSGRPNHRVTLVLSQKCSRSKITNKKNGANLSYRSNLSQLQQQAGTGSPTRCYCGSRIKGGRREPGTQPYWITRLRPSATHKISPFSSCPGP